MFFGLPDRVIDLVQELVFVKQIRFTRFGLGVAWFGAGVEVGTLPEFMDLVGVLSVQVLLYFQTPRGVQ